MVSASRMGVVRAASLAVMLALAAMGARPLVLPLAAQIWASNAAVVDGTDATDHGVLPAKTALRLMPKLRHTDSGMDPPQPCAVTVRAEAIPAGTARTGDGYADVATAPVAQFLDHRPRGPPFTPARPNAAGPLEAGRVFGSLKRA